MSKNADKTYLLCDDEKRIYGFASGRKAIEQMIYKTLSTERYEWDIYSDDYGSELYQLFGKPKAQILEEAEQVITDTFADDERISEVGDFAVSETAHGVEISFRVKTDYGDIVVSKEIG